MFGKIICFENNMFVLKYVCIEICYKIKIKMVKIRLE